MLNSRCNFHARWNSNSGKSSGEDGTMKSSKPARGTATWAHAAFAAICGFAYSGMALALEWNLQPSGSKLAADIHNLHEYVMILCTVIFIGVFSFMFWSVYAHRKSVGHEAANFHENTTVEIIWTIIPFFILIGMAYPAIKTLIAMRDTSRPELTIKPAAMVSFKHLSDADIAAFHLHAQQLGQQDRQRGHPARRQIFAEVSTH